MRLVVVCCLAAGCGFDHGWVPGTNSDAALGDGRASDARLVDASMVTPDAPPDAASATAVVLHPNADTWIREQFPTELHGYDVDLRTGSGSTTARANRLIVQFDVSSLPTTCAISDASLFLYFFQEDFVNVSPTLEAHRVTVSWAEPGATWNNRTATSSWTLPGGDFDAAIAGSTVIQAGSLGWHSWDLTALTTAWRSGLSANYGVEILQPSDNAGTGGRKLFYSSDSNTTNGDFRPYLHVTCGA